MRIGTFLLLILTVLLLAGATVWLAQTATTLALLPALGTVILVCTVLVRQAR